MDISAAIKAADEKTCRAVLEEVLKQYMSPAFSALPKKEIDLVVLNALERLGYVSSDPTLYEVVQRLRVTRAKARNLLYDRELRRIDADQLDQKVRDALKNPLVQKQGELFVLEIENPLVADHLRAKVQQLGHASDGSFSPSLVKLTIDAVTALIADCLTEADQEKVRKALIKAGAPDKSIKGVIKAALKQAGKKIAQNAGEGVVENVSEYMAPLIDGASGKISKAFAGMFSSSPVDE